ncbi:hypothetical protein C7121_29110 [Paenibacillus glucanolyticus]|nr:hypothetical protein A3958_15940 [Paenibacillus glucanolyticus]AVV59895.1 hypothetical protein C7121_29110 [Paenibacillus glucanolyticus]AWP29153.1 hypothetical protein B9D94_22170 [Paenibacillus sp. Cedars]OMF72198.1 hypothetical protein BK142_20820 [Paenibacillus glucanolyticus]
MYGIGAPLIFMLTYILANGKYILYLFTKVVIIMKFKSVIWIIVGIIAVLILLYFLTNGR